MIREIRTIPLDLIDVEGRLRGVDEAAAAELAGTLETDGLIHPIILRVHPEDPSRYQLVAGAHRLMAHELIGQDEIAAEIRDLTDDEAEAIEEVENLARRGLKVIERVIAVGRFKQRQITAFPETAAGGSNGNQYVGGKTRSSRSATYSSILSDQTGRSVRSFEEDAALFEALGEEALRDLVGSSVEDNAVQLKALSALGTDQQKACVESLSNGAHKSVKEWRIAVGDLPEKIKPSAPEDIWFEKITGLFGEGQKKWQDRFRDFLREGGA